MIFHSYVNKLHQITRVTCITWYNMIWVWSYHSNPSPPPIFAQWLSGWNGLELQESHPVLKLGLAKAENSKGKWEEAGHGENHFKLFQVMVFPPFFCHGLFWVLWVLAEFESSGHRFSHGFATESAIGPNSLPSGPPVTWLLIGFPTSLRVGKGTSDWIIQLCTWSNMCSLSLWHIQYPCLLLEASGCCWCEKNMSPQIAPDSLDIVCASKWGLVHWCWR